MNYVSRSQAYLNDNMHVKFFSVKANSFIECCSLAIIEIHCHIHLQNIHQETKQHIKISEAKDSFDNDFIFGLVTFTNTFFTWSSTS